MWRTVCYQFKKLTDKGLNVNFRKSYCFLTVTNGKLMFAAQNKGGIYTIDTEIENEDVHTIKDKKKT